MFRPLEYSSTVSRSLNKDRCSRDSCEENDLDIEKLTEDDCVFLLLHGNAKVRMKYLNYDYFLVNVRTEELDTGLLPTRFSNLWVVTR